jgi:ABC-type proline/glycine betaine transport system ATPase subunit
MLFLSLTRTQTTTTIIILNTQKWDKRNRKKRAQEKAQETGIDAETHTLRNPIKEQKLESIIYIQKR